MTRTLPTPFTFTQGVEYDYGTKLMGTVALVFGLMLCPLVHLLRMRSKVLRRTSDYWFKVLNTDGSGALTRQEFKAFLKSKLKLNKDDIDELINRSDSNGDAGIGACVCVRICACRVYVISTTAVCGRTPSLYLRLFPIHLTLLLFPSPPTSGSIHRADLQEFEVVMQEARAYYRTDIQAFVVRDVMVVILLFHPFVSKLAMKAWDCKKVTSSNGKEVEYLATDMTIECYTSDNWKGIAVFSGATLLVFSIGAPAFILLVLVRYRHKLGEKATYKRYIFGHGCVCALYVGVICMW